MKVNLVKNTVVFLCFSFFIAAGSLLAFDFDYSVSMGGNYNDIETKGSTSSEAKLYNLTGKVDFEVEINEKFWSSCSISSSILKENDDEAFFDSEKQLFKDTVKYSNFEFELIGGMNICCFFKPALGFSLSKTKLERDSEFAVTNLAPLKQEYDGIQWLAGFKGGYEFTDYFWAGYKFLYGESDSQDAKSNSSDIGTVDRTTFNIKCSIKYWLPNEFCRVGVDLDWGKKSFDKITTQKASLPDTDIENAGIMINCTVLI